MTGVTILDLKDYRHLLKEIRTIDEELEWIYFPVSCSVMSDSLQLHGL